MDVSNGTITPEELKDYSFLIFDVAGEISADKIKSSDTAKYFEIGFCGCGSMRDYKTPCRSNPTRILRIKTTKILPRSLATSQETEAYPVWAVMGYHMMGVSSLVTEIIRKSTNPLEIGVYCDPYHFHAVHVKGAGHSVSPPWR